MKNSNKLFLSVSVILCLVALTLLARGAVAGPTAPVEAQPAVAVQPIAPEAINSPSSLLFSYQGQLTDVAGVPIPNARLPMTFKLYTVASEGAPFWTEIYTGAQAITVTNGLFHVQLGSLTPLDATQLTGDVYLELTVNDEMLSPRELLTSVAFAVEANTLAAGATTRGNLTVPGSFYASGNSGFGTSSAGARARLSVVGGALSISPSPIPADATLHIQGALGLGDRLLQMSPVGASQPAVALVGSTDAAGNGQWWEWGVTPANTFRIAPGFSLGGATGLAIAANGDVSVGGMGTFSRDGVGGLGQHTLNVAESTLATNKKADIGFHNAGVSEGYIRLDYGYENRRFVFGADQTDMDGAFTGSLYVGNGAQTSASGVYLGGDTNEHVALYEDGDQTHLFIAPWGGPGRLYDEVTIGSGSDYKTNLGVWGNISTNGGLSVGQPGSGEGGEIYLQPGDSGNGWNIDNYRGTYRLHHDGVGYFSVSPTGAVSCGALVEANLQTQEEKAASQIVRFGEGDVLCWGIDQLELCATANDRLVQAVADKDGKPIVLGAEKVKVLGPVQRGDILVASDVPGYAMVNNDPRSGSVVAQALENFDGQRGVIKAMIRKW